MLFSETRRARGHRKRAESLTTPPPASYRRVYRPLGLSSRSALSVPSLLLGSSSSPMIASLALSNSPLSSSRSLSRCLLGSSPRPGGVASSVLGGTSTVTPSSLGGIPSFLGNTSPNLGGTSPDLGGTTPSVLRRMM